VKKRYENGAACPTPLCDGIYEGKTAAGLCNKCYIRYRRGKAEGLVGNRCKAIAGQGSGRWPEYRPWPECLFDGCLEASRTRSGVPYCSGHYQQLKKGNELAPLINKRWAVVDGRKQCSNCLEWSELHDFAAVPSRDTTQAVCRPCMSIIKRMRQYGGTYDQMKELVGRGRCDICGQECVVQIDHCHSTNRIRGALCTRCNLSLGQLEDSPSLLRLMLGYLLRHAVSFGGAA